MKRTGQIVGLLALLGASTALAQELAELTRPAPPDPALGGAVASKVLSCYAAEGGVLTDDDREVVEAFASELSAALGGALGGGECAEGKDCAAAVAALPCAELAQRLSRDDLAGPPALWAETWSGALRDRVTACYTTESGGALPSAEEQTRVEAFRAGLARSLTVLGAQPTCRVNTAALPPCVAAIGGLRCDALSEGVSDPEHLLTALSSACAGLLRCSLDPLDALDLGL